MPTGTFTSLATPISTAVSEQYPINLNPLGISKEVMLSGGWEECASDLGPGEFNRYYSHTLDRGS